MIAQADEKVMSFTDHLGELRHRLLYIVVILLCGTAITLFFAKNIFQYLQIPLLKALPQNSHFIALTPLEGWMVYFKIALMTALFATSPLWFYHIWAFIAPAVKRNHHRHLLCAAAASSILFICGGLVCFFLILPYSFHYFISILNHTNIIVMPQIRLYLSLIVRIIIGFGIVFQIPLVTLLLVRWNVVSVEKLKKCRKYVILSSFIVAAIVTPPDVITQIIVALPLILLFELSLFVAHIFQRKKRDAS